MRYTSNRSATVQRRIVYLLAVAGLGASSGLAALRPSLGALSPPRRAAWASVSQAEPRTGQYGAEIEVSPDATPEITQVKPSQAGAGDEVTLTIAGRNFSRGAYVSFTNPAIHVVSTRRVSATQLEARVAIGGRVTAGAVSLYVSNPASSVAETLFTITGALAPSAPEAEGVASGSSTAASAAAPTASPAPAATPASTPAPAAIAGSTTQRFQVYNLGDVVSILESSNKPKGTLAISGGRLSYQEGDKEVFSVPLGEIKEVEANTLLGVNTGTFHVILNSGKTYNFVAASLRPAESQQIVDSLRKALP